MSAPTAQELAERLNEILAEAGQKELAPELALRFGAFGALLLRWNERMNLTAVRDADGVLRRHFAECIEAARCLPAGIDTLLDYGSGAGFPGIPIALCRPEIAVTLAESQSKKAMFLREALRTVELDSVVYAGRAETLHMKFGCVALRAVDNMEAAVRGAAALVRNDGWLAMLTTGADRENWQSLAAEFRWSDTVPVGGDDRVLVLGRRG